MRALLFAGLLCLQEPVSYEGLRWVDGAPPATGKPRLVRWWTQG